MITIVSGLPRSGTSLMMQMLDAGGLPALSDGERKSDIDNPRGYLEWERIKQLPRDPTCIAEAEGKVVKVISQLLFSLSYGYDYRIIFMQRPLPEVLKSQDEMLGRRGTSATSGDNATVQKAFQRHLVQVDKWLAEKENISVLRMEYRRVLDNPLAAAGEIAAFLDISLNIGAMAQQVDSTLYRNRAELT